MIPNHDDLAIAPKSTKSSNLKYLMLNKHKVLFKKTKCSDSKISGEKFRTKIIFVFEKIGTKIP